MAYQRQLLTPSAGVLCLIVGAVAILGSSIPLDPPAKAAANEFVVRMTPIADTWIEMPMTVPPGIPTVLPNATPRGDDDALRSGWSHRSPSERSLLRFAVPTTQPDTMIEEAVLDLTLVDAAVSTYGPPELTFGTMTLSLASVTSAWDEAELTGAGPLPAFGAVEHRDEVPWGPCGDGHCGTMSVDVLRLVRRWAADRPASNHGLAIDARHGGPEPSYGAYIVASSRESSTPPELRLRYVFVDIAMPPTPTTDPPGDAPEHVWMPWVGAGR